MAKPSTPYSSPAGVNEKKLPSNVNVRYLYQPSKLEDGTPERVVAKSNELVIYYLHDGPKRGFVREELLVVSLNTQLLCAHVV